MIEKSRPTLMSTQIKVMIPLHFLKPTSSLSLTYRLQTWPWHVHPLGGGQQVLEPECRAKGRPVELARFCVLPTAPEMESVPDSLPRISFKVVPMANSPQVCSPFPSHPLYPLYHCFPFFPLTHPKLLRSIPAACLLP